MAIKGIVDVNVEDIYHVCDVSGDAGTLVIYPTGGQATGEGVGQGLNGEATVVTVPGTGTPASGTVVAGVLLQDVEDIYAYALTADGTTASGLAAGIGDPSVAKYAHRNYHKTTAVVGEPVRMAKDAVISTNWIVGTPAAGNPAYLGASGKFDTTQRSSIPAVGKFLTAKDTNGYAKVSIKLA